jgi:hypothetical protein
LTLLSRCRAGLVASCVELADGRPDDCLKDAANDERGGRDGGSCEVHRNIVS